VSRNSSGQEEHPEHTALLAGFDVCTKQEVDRGRRKGESQKTAFIALQEKRPSHIGRKLLFAANTSMADECF
jgi:hypothetical protein